MKIHDVVQGGTDWLRLRLGIPTSSRFHEIITPKTQQFSKQSRGYMRELLAEWMVGDKWLDGDLVSEPESAWMTRGKELEPEAVSWYEMHMDLDVQRVGFVTNDEATVGCSPDGLISGNGGLEAKCPGPKRHVENLLGEKGPAKATQIQGGLWLAEREWWDVLSYHPHMPRVLIRVHRDEPFIEALSAAVGQFNEELHEAKERLAPYVGANVVDLDILKEIAA